MIDRELVKKHLNVLTTDDDQLIDLYIAAAVDTAENATDAERERYRAGVEELLCWEWAEEGRAMRRGDR